MLKASALESDFFARWAGYYAQTLNARQELSVTNQTLGVLPTLLAALASLLVLTVGGLRVMEGALSLGMLVAFQSLMHSLLTPVTTLVNLGGTLQELWGGTCSGLTTCCGIPSTPPAMRRQQDH